MNTVKERVRTIITEELGCLAEEIGDDVSVADLGADSLHCVEIVMALEEDFDIEIQDQEAESLMTVNDMVAYLKGRGFTDENS